MSLAAAVKASIDLHRQAADYAELMLDEAMRANSGGGDFTEMTRWHEVMNSHRKAAGDLERALAPAPPPGLEKLGAIGFTRLDPAETQHNPLRLYLVMPVRTDDGLWHSSPIMSAPLPEDCEALLKLAHELHNQRKPRRFVEEGKKT